jgi:hypothetical protein
MSAPVTVSLPNFARESVLFPYRVQLEQFWISLVKEYVMPFTHRDHDECTSIQGCRKRLAIGADKCNPCLRVLREYFSAPAKSIGQMFSILLTIDCFLTFCIMAGMSGMIVEALGSRLYLIGYLLHPAETKLRDPRAVINSGRIED